MYGREEAFKKSADFAHCTTAILSGVGLVAGFILSSTVCRPELSEWNIVNGVLCGALSLSLHFSKTSCPRTLENAYRLLSGNLSMRELMADGMLVAAVTAGHVLLPAALLLWTFHGLFSLTIGLCAESAPLFFCATVLSMLAQIVVIFTVARINLEAAGYNVLEFEVSVIECASKTKDVAFDIGRTGYSMARRTADQAVPMVYAAIEKGRRMYETRPHYLTMQYWMSQESRSLLRY